MCDENVDPRSGWRSFDSACVEDDDDVVDVDDDDDQTTVSAHTRTKF